MPATDDQIANALEAEMDTALEELTEAQMQVGLIYAKSMLYAYNKWLEEAGAYSSKEKVEEFIDIEEERADSGN